jgi:putative ABC transport system ATP-binding protein
MEDFVRFSNVKRVYRMGEVEIEALAGLDLSVRRGEFVVAAGPSGAGKTTFLNILGGMDRATSGEAIVDGEDITEYSYRRLVAYRREDIGFVFQFYNLIQNLTALENVELAVQICRDHFPPEEILEHVGLGDRMGNFPAQLSGGEQQRVAIARALAKNPKILLCDEPTGALDYETGKSILKLLRETGQRYDITVVVVTHNQALKPMADRVIELREGRTSRMVVNEHPEPVENIEW